MKNDDPGMIYSCLRELYLLLQAMYKMFVHTMLKSSFLSEEYCTVSCVCSGWKDFSKIPDEK